MGLITWTRGTLLLIFLVNILMSCLLLILWTLTRGTSWIFGRRITGILWTIEPSPVQDIFSDRLQVFAFTSERNKILKKIEHDIAIFISNSRIARCAWMTRHRTTKNRKCVVFRKTWAATCFVQMVEQWWERENRETKDKWHCLLSASPSRNMEQAPYHESILYLSEVLWAFWNHGDLRVDYWKTNKYKEST